MLVAGGPGVVAVQTSVGNYITSGGVILHILDVTDHLVGLFKPGLGHTTSDTRQTICCVGD